MRAFKSALRTLPICLLMLLLGTPQLSAAGLPAAKRVAPPEVRPVTVAGIRYTVVLATRARGLPQEGGYIAAIDVKSDREIWLRRIYETQYLPELEEDVQDVFIRSMKLGNGGRTLEIVDELDRHHRLDLEPRRRHP
nr:hypothetical protein [Dechloromonas sp.]